MDISPLRCDVLLSLWPFNYFQGWITYGRVVNHDNKSFSFYPTCNQANKIKMCKEHFSIHMRSVHSAFPFFFFLLWTLDSVVLLTFLRPLKSRFHSTKIPLPLFRTIKQTWSTKSFAQRQHKRRVTLDNGEAQTSKGVIFIFRRHFRVVQSTTKNQ